MAKPAHKIQFAHEPMLVISAWMSAIVFGLFSAAALSALTSGVKSSEVFVASLYSSGCVIAFIGAVLLIAHSYRWAMLVCLGALIAAVGGYAFEPDFQDEAAYGAAMILIGGPALLALLVGSSYIHAASRRVNPHDVPSARAKDA